MSFVALAWVLTFLSVYYLPDYFKKKKEISYSIIKYKEVNDDSRKLNE